MKTLLSLVATLVLLTAIVSLDAYRLDADVLFFAVAVAGLFGFAINDSPPPLRLTRRQLVCRH